MDGIYHKYDVYNASSGERIQDCFVMRPGSDRAAVVALRAYAKATENRELAADITKWVGEGEWEPNRVLTLEELKALPEIVWHEENKTVFAPATPLEPKIPYSISTNVVCEGRAITYTDGESHGFGGYNKFWRCWLRKPTDQERAAVPWKGKRNEKPHLCP